MQACVSISDFLLPCVKFDFFLLCSAPEVIMQKFFIALIWAALSALLVKYSFQLAFDYYLDFLSSTMLVLTLVWFVSFFKSNKKQ
jgi:membrane protein implicated in regulation of membrane protease activity